jgi:hypothetical protein
MLLFLVMVLVGIYLYMLFEGLRCQASEKTRSQILSTRVIETTKPPDSFSLHGGFGSYRSSCSRPITKPSKQFINICNIFSLSKYKSTRETDFIRVMPLPTALWALRQTVRRRFLGVQGGC